MPVYANRHECKYLVSEATAAQLLRRVRPYVAPDPHAAVRPDHTYPIASLYLDNAPARLYGETRDGCADRFKLRVRSYGDDPSLPVFAEIKQRRGGVVQKQRCPVPRPRLPLVLAGDADAVPGLSPAAQRALREFVRLQELLGATPQLVVRYDRQAYAGYDDDEVRITFDRRLAVRREPQAQVLVRAPGFATVPAGGVVLELKFCDRCPPWLHDAVQALELRRRSFSKYCTCRDALGLGDSAAAS